MNIDDLQGARPGRIRTNVIKDIMKINDIEGA